MKTISPIRWYKELDSTNNEARRHFEAIDNLSVISTVSQTSGRGQGDHTWFATPGLNLTFTLVLKYDFEFAARDQILVTCLTTLAIRDYLLSKGVTARIKWPNDIWVGDRKICGILIENTVEEGMIRGSIIGIGLNINEKDWPSNLPNPVSLRNLTGRKYCTRLELRRLYKKICRRFEQLQDSDGRNSLQEEFGKYVFRLP